MQTIKPLDSRTESAHMTSTEAAARIAKALKARTGIAYSVTAGRGTIRSWVIVDIAVERRQLPTAAEEREALARQLGFARWEGTILVPGTVEARGEYLARALGVERAEPEESLSSMLMPLADDPGRGSR